MGSRLLALVCLFMVGPLSLAFAVEPADPLQIVTYNIRYASRGDGEDVWPNRVEAVSSFLSKQDLSGLQEVTLAQLEQLQERLPDFDSYGVGRDDGKSGGEHAAIFFRKDRFEPLEKGTFWLSEKPDQIGVAGWDAALPRTCTWMILKEKSSGASVLVANTHFDHRGAAARTESGKLIRRELQQRAGDLPVILLGDFNCLPGAEPYQALLEGEFLADAKSLSKSEPTGPDSTWCGFKEIIPGRVIDHIFVHGDLAVNSFETLDPKTSGGRFASDHLPVRVTVALGNAEAKN